MLGKITRNRSAINKTVIFKDQRGYWEYSVGGQAQQQVYYDPAGKRIGHVDSLGRTFSQSNRLLNRGQISFLLNSEGRRKSILSVH